MDPVLQHLGDVTIQRLEKPKTKPDVLNESPSEDNTEDKADLKDDLQQLKRSSDDSNEGFSKKFKIGQSEISITEKPKLNFPNLPNTSQSEDELSEYESEFEYDSEGELDSELPIIKKPPEAPKETEESEEPNESFLDELVEKSFDGNKPAEVTIKTETESCDTEDYEYDIKEKLKEMGEISFETVKKGEKPKKIESVSENEVTVTPAKKSSEEDNSSERKGPLSSSMLRRNIREVMDEAKLDESTLAAQRQEMERLQRVQEQQRIIREVQRQVAQEKMQNKVLSLLQGGNLSKPGTSGTRIGNTVLVKLPNGETKPMTKIGKRPFELVKVQKSPPGPLRPPRSLLSPVRPPSQGQLTPSVSIAPVIKKPSQAYRPRSDSDSESEEFKYQKLLSKTRPKESPVATIDLSSDDDCVVVSETETDTGQDDEIIEDPANSGMHTNDEFNQPDEQGRVVINIGHPDGEPDVYLAPQIARIIKPHQIGGVRFLYDNVVESLNRFHNSTGFGCILAHSMGLGKTLQVVCFSDVFLRHTPARTILCIMPINTLQNWLAEYNMWLPTEDDAAKSALQIYGDVRPRMFNLHVLNDSHKTLVARSKVIQEWRTGGGVLLIGYEQYRLLSLRKQPKSRRKPHLIEPEDEDKNRKLFDDIHSALVTPGPDLVICDEGHRIKNSHASISQALKQMRTKRRIVLTGYPLQNNLMEYWCMVDFVRPNYLGSKTEFCNMFERPIQNGQCIDSTEADIKLMRYRAHVLHSLLVGFVQRRSHEVLQTALPQKEEYVLLLRMSSFQRKLYNTFMNEVVRVQAVPNPLKAFAVCCKIWNHPDVLYHFLKKRAGGEAVDIDLEEVSNNSPTDASGKPKKNTKRNTNAKGRKGAKPAASVTPYNSATTDDSNLNQPSLPQSLVSSSTPQNSNSSLDVQFPPVSEVNQTPSVSTSSPASNNFNASCFTQQSQNFSLNENKSPSYSQNQNFSENQFSQSNFLQGNQSLNFSSQQNCNSTNTFSNFQQQNYWGQKEPSDFFGNFKQQFGPSSAPTDIFNSGNSCDSSQMSQWMKKEEDKSLIPNVMNSPMRGGGENSCGSNSDSKPKIKIISDIKIGSSFPGINKNVSDGKKINIISDIKLEVKKEESNDDKMFPRFPFEGIKNEFKSSLAQNYHLPHDDEDVKIVSTDMPPPVKIKEDPPDGIPYDWAVELLRDYIPGCIENSGKMEVLFCIIRESIALNDRLLLFSQSLITLDLVEQFLQTNNVPGETERWSKNTNYYRLDGSTSALEREKLINEFNSNPKIHLFLVSTRAGSLGINLVGANRVVVLDASWNPCHDTQAVCRVYRYGQRKPCFVYRLVMDHCLEKKIYDRQINKQGMSDRVVDECNPDAHLTMKDVSTLCFDDSEEGEVKDWSHVKDRYIDIVLQKVLTLYGDRLNKPPFQHESLLVDRKDKQLSQQEKRLAKKSYEREKQAARQPAYSLAAAARSHRPIASVRPMQQGGERPTRWIPAEHWQRQGMTAQEMTLPLDVVIPTNQPDKSNIILKAGQKVLVLKSPKGVYMQLENGKIVAIKTAIKVRGKAEDEADKIMKPNFVPILKPPPPGIPLMPPKRMVRPMNVGGMAKLNMRSVRQAVPNLVSRMQNVSRKVQMAKTRPYHIGTEIARSVNQSKDMDGHLMVPKPDDLMGRSKSHLHKNNPLPNELAHRLLSDEITMERYSPKTEKQKMQLKPEISLQSSLLKNLQRSLPKPRGRSPSSTIQQLEQSTSAIISETKQRIQDITDMANSFQEDEKLQSSSETSSLAPLDSDHLQDLDTGDDVEDLEQHYQEETPPSTHPPSTSTSSTMPIPPDSIKTDIPNQDYNYNGYYGYNMQPYPPPPQNYNNYPPQPPPYEYNYPPPQQPQYNYAIYPQTYPPQPQYPPPPQAPPYEYGPPPPQPPPPMYGGYHSPYPQQYTQPPPPPQNPYPPVAPPPPSYTDYQYNASAPPQNASTNPAPYYPNS